MSTAVLSSSAPEATKAQDHSPLGVDHQKLRTVFVGHVDHGKSTLIGRILHDTNSLPEGKLEKALANSKLAGTAFEYAHLLDALIEEQDQNITIDTTQIQFRTEKRDYVIIDAPGHKEFLKNMVTGAASADAAILLIDAAEGVREQSRRHGILLSMLGIRQVIVAVNKMDLVNYEEAAYQGIVSEYTEFLGKLDLKPRHFIPLSARNGENIVKASEHLSWYKGPSIVGALDELDNPRQAVQNSVLRFPIQDIYRFDHRRILAGRIETGKITVGDSLVFSPGGKTSIVASIERFNGPDRNYAVAGESIGITLTEQIFVERGHIASHEEGLPVTTNSLGGRLFWMSHTPLQKGQFYKLKLATQVVDCELMTINRVIDSTTLEAVEGDIKEIRRNDVADVHLRTRSPLVLDNHDRVDSLGRFVIMADGTVGGGGIITGATYPKSGSKSRNIYWSEGNITATNRARRNGHKGAIVWLTGLSGSGKSTISRAVERELFQRGMHTYVLDGDNIRHGLNSNLGFSHEDRTENIRRVAEVAQLMADSGLITLTAFISPYREDRRRARQIATQNGSEFIEIFINAPLEVCEQRDPKNLYKKARAGQIKDFTGIDAPYEAPEEAEITIQTDKVSVDGAVELILGELQSRLRYLEDESSGFEI